MQILRTFIYVLIFSFNAIGVFAQQTETNRLIAASQAGAMPLYFDVNNPKTANIHTGNRNYELEFFHRAGLPNFLYKAKKGDSLKLGFIGGSITRADGMYRTQAAKYLQKIFPKAKMVGLNAGISGTGSDLGACRVSTQLLTHHPDLVFIEFAVNGAFAAGVEGIIRQVRKHNPETEICLIYTIGGGQAEQYVVGKIPENIRKLENVAEHYQIPSVHLGASIGIMQQEGKLIWKGNNNKEKIVFSADGLHPTNEGGNLYAAAIGRFFESILDEKTPTDLVRYELPKALLADNWENAKMLDPLGFASFKGNWLAVDPTKTLNINEFKPWFPYVMSAAKPGSEFTFKFKGDVFGLFDIGGPEVGQLEIFVDEKAVMPDRDSLKFIVNRFNSYCNNRYRGQYVKFKVPTGEHTVRVMISQDIPDKAQLLGVGQLADIKKNPEKYNRSVIYLGKILIKGEPLKMSK